MKLFKHAFKLFLRRGEGDLRLRGGDRLGGDLLRGERRLDFLLGTLVY